MIETLKVGIARGFIEFRHTLTNGQDLWGYFFPSFGLLITLFFMGVARVPGTSFPLGASTLPSSIGMLLAFGGLATIAQYLIVEREDGTLLRAKATPNGMNGYLIGKVVGVGGMTLASVLVVLVPGLLLVDGLQVDAGGVLTLLWLLPLAVVATVPIGASIGSLFDNSRSLGLVLLPIFGIVAISGIFYPLGALPGWLQGIGQVFPVYWLGLGMRSVFLPDAFAVVELGDSWRHFETFGVLTVWAIAGLALAPALLRRMARRESGSAVAARRERALTSMAR